MLGVLLLQDIAVVPLLVLLPIIESQNGANSLLSDQLGLVGMTVAKGVGGLGGILVAGRFLLRPFFDLVAGERGREKEREREKQWGGRGCCTRHSYPSISSSR